MCSALFYIGFAIALFPTVIAGDSDDEYVMVGDADDGEYVVVDDAAGYNPTDSCVQGTDGKSLKDGTHDAEQLRSMECGFGQRCCAQCTCVRHDRAAVNNLMRALVKGHCRLNEGQTSCTQPKGKATTMARKAGNLAGKFFRQVSLGSRSGQ